MCYIWQHISKKKILSLFYVLNNSIFVFIFIILLPLCNTRSAENLIYVKYWIFIYCIPGQVCIEFHWKISIILVEYKPFLCWNHLTIYVLHFLIYNWIGMDGSLSDILNIYAITLRTACDIFLLNIVIRIWFLKGHKI